MVLSNTILKREIATIDNCPPAPQFLEPIYGCSSSHSIAFSVPASSIIRSASGEKYTQAEIRSRVHGSGSGLRYPPDFSGKPNTELYVILYSGGIWVKCRGVESAYLERQVRQFYIIEQVISEQVILPKCFIANVNGSR